jgi:hypothetical protein
MIFFKSLSNFRINYFLLFFAFFLFFALPSSALYSLYRISDTISTSEPNIEANHTIRFILSTAIPSSGQIIISPEGGFFDIHSSFNYTDVDFATSSSIDGPFVDRSLTSSPTATQDGVSVVSGTNGNITITLNSNFGIGAGTYIQIELGTNATAGATGDQQILNSDTNGSYDIYIETYDASSNLLDGGTAIIAIVSPVSLSAGTLPDTSPPVRYNGLPSGTLPIGTQSVSLSLNTDEWSYCRYSTTSGVAYSSMTNILSSSPSIFHSTVLSDLLGGLTYNFYIRCIDTKSNVNTDDYIISFFIPVPTGGGGGAPFPPKPGLPEVVFEGWAYPLSKVFILKDGNVEAEIQTQVTAFFEYTVSDLEQGVYTFSVWAEDTDGRRSITDTSTFLVREGTRTTLSIFLPPTIELSKDTLDAGETLEIFGQGIPKSIIEAWIYPSVPGQEALEEEVMKSVTEAIQGGSWTLLFDTSLLGKGTYEVKAKSSFSQAGTSEFGRILYFGIGEAPVVGLCERSDLNKDTKVNLVDFSILLYNWQTADPVADINMDGIVNLTDFSIMMYCWTG